MLTPRRATIVAAILLAAALPAGAQEPPPPAVPEVVQIEDPAGDSNYLNSQGTGATEGDRTTPQDLSVSDILKVWFTHDAETISVNVQTEAPPPSSNAAYLFRVFTNPGEGFPNGCLWWEGFVEGPTFVGEAFARLQDQCSDVDPVEGVLTISTMADETGLVTITFPREANAAFADGGLIVAPIGEVRNVTGAAAARFVTAPVADDTKVGSDYTVTPPEEEPTEPPKKKKKKKKG